VDKSSALATKEANKTVMNMVFNVSHFAFSRSFRQSNQLMIDITGMADYAKHN